MDANHLGPPYQEEGYALMAAAFEVHNEIGGGLLEDVYQECLEIELQMRDIPFRSKQQLHLYYKARRLEKLYIPDLFVYDGIVVDLKAASQLTSAHEAQLLNYMRISRQPVGYLINFGPIDRVQWKRFLLSEFCHH